MKIDKKNSFEHSLFWCWWVQFIPLKSKFRKKDIIDFASLNLI